MLTALQHGLRQLVDEIPEAGNVALAGGGALIVLGVDDRFTTDLDYFATSEDEVNRLLPALETRLRHEGLGVERVHVASGFARLRVCWKEETTLVDLARDARLYPLDRAGGGFVLAEDELAADKLPGGCRTGPAARLC